MDELDFDAVEQLLDSVDEKKRDRSRSRGTRDRDRSAGPPAAAQLSLLNSLNVRTRY